MNKIVVVIVLMAVCACSGPKQVGEDIPFTWLSGQWQLETGDRTLTETWWMDPQGNMQGETWVSGEGTDSTKNESLAIVLRREKFFYVADVTGAEGPVYFDINETGENYFVAENPYHDFPKRIRYVLKRDSLIAVISGNGTSKEFHYARLER